MGAGPPLGPVAFNVNEDERGTGRELYANHMIGRMWEIDNSEKWSWALENQFQFPATNKVNFLSDAHWTHNTKGFPLDCIPEVIRGQCASLLADIPIIGIEVTSGDTSGRGDDFVFVHNTIGTNDTSWSAVIGARSSNVGGREWAKGCLMARASAAVDLHEHLVHMPTPFRERR